MTPALAGAAVMMALAGGAGWSPAAIAQDASQPVRQVVLDIISFSRWPEPHGEVRLCVVGQTEHAGALMEGIGRSGTTPVRPQRVATGDERLRTGCDVVYAGQLAPVERDQVIRYIVGRPVLTVGEAGPGCGETTMFCLHVVGVQVSFATNLDAISRSGVRLNPRVLLLGRRPAATGAK